MPKPIRAIVEIEESSLGRVMRQCNVMAGVVSFNLDLDEDTKKKRPGVRKHGGPSNKVLGVKVLLAAKSALSSADLKKKVIAAGGSDTISSVLTEMKKAGYITQPKEFHWQMTAKGRKWATEWLAAREEMSKLNGKTGE